MRLLVLDHLSLHVRNYAASKRFYEAALAPLGYRLLMDLDDAAGFGEPGYARFWVNAKSAPSTRVHIAFAAPTRGAVDAFFNAAIAAGGRDHGPPGLRPRYHEHYYAAFVLDPDGNNIEAVAHSLAA